MARDRIGMGIEEFLRVVHGFDPGGQSDGQLLRQFLFRQDEAAFAALMSRHGPMVLGVCRRILGNAHDAEDAFQATFVVLVRKAPSLTSRAVLGDWLHGVARRTALNAKRIAMRRRQKEKALARPEMQKEEIRDDRLLLLDEALGHLPEKYRLVLVLCELEGRTRREAAERLGWPEGTVAGRLARGRALLARQLLRHGLTLAAGSTAALFPVDAAPACVPPSLVSATIKAAMSIAAGQAAMTGAISAPVAALTEGVLRQMFLTKLKLATTVLFLAVLLGAGGTAGVLAYLVGDEQSGAQQQAAPKSDKEKPAGSPQKRQARFEMEKNPRTPDKADEEDLIRPGDLLNIRSPSSLPDLPIQGIFQVEASGKVALGPVYGRVNIKGLTFEEAEERITEHLRKMIKGADGVSVTRPIPDNPALERRVQQLESEVRALRSVVEELRKKARD